jgi:hypothetical protein
MAAFDADEARRLHGEGRSSNAIARELGVAQSTISRWAAREGLSFDRSMTRPAVAAHTFDMKAARLKLAESMVTAAQAMLDRIDDPYLVYAFGGRDNDYNEHELESAPVEVRRNIITTAGIAFDKATRIVEHDAGGLDDAVGTLDILAAGFKAAAEQLRDRPDE